MLGNYVLLSSGSITFSANAGNLPINRPLAFPGIIFHRLIRDFFRNAVLHLGLNLTVKGVYLFGVERAVQNTLPRGDYGLYFSLLGLAMLLQVVADAGLQLYNSRELAGNRSRLAKYFPHFVRLKFVLGSIFFLLLFPTGWLLGYRGEALALLVMAGGVQLLLSVVLYLRSNLSGLGKYALEGWFGILDKSLLGLVIGSWLLLSPASLTIWHFAGMQLASLLVSAGLLVWVVRDQLPRRWPAWRGATLIALLRGGAPFALAIFLATAATRLDAVMIERLLPDGGVAADHYAAGYRLLDALNTIGWLLAGLLIPMYARLRAQGEDHTPLLRFSAQLLLAGSLSAAVPLACFAAPVTRLLYDFADERTAQVLGWLALTFVAQSWNYAYGALLSATGHVGRMNRIFGFGILLNLLGNLYVLPVYGVAGAAAVTLLTQTFIALTQALLAHRWLAVPGGTIAWGRVLLLAALLGTCGRALSSLHLPWLLSLVGLGVFGLLTASGLRLIDWQAVRQLPAKKV